MSRFVLPAAALCCLLLAQCQPAPAPTPAPTQLELLPPATQSGARTFGCLVNGQAWTPAGDPFAGPLFTVYYNFRDSTLSIQADRTGKINGLQTSQLIGMVARRVTKKGIYVLADSKPANGNTRYNLAYYEDLKINCSYYTDATHPATLTLTKFDEVKRIASGTFSFTLEQPDYPY